MVGKEDVLKTGRAVYLQYEDTRKMIYSNHKFADEASNAAPAYILAETRFISGHDDTALFVEIIDTDGKIARRWTFYDIIQIFDEPRLYDDDCLILYLNETIKIPVKRGWGYERLDGRVMIEELF